ncbi:MAG: hypothetical protein DRI36_06105, partial [Caldiserica bacterium]
ASSIDFYKLNFLKEDKKPLKEIYPDVGEIFHKYQEFLYKRNWLDFRDLVIYGIKILEKKEVLDNLGIKYLFVDEIENLDENSLRFLKIILKNVSVAYLTFNPEGGIYLFRGGVGKKAIDYFSEVKFERINFEKKENGVEIEISTHQDEYLEVMWVLRSIRKLLRSGVSPENIAVIVRDVDVRVKFIEELSKLYNIPLQIKAGIPILREAVVSNFISFLLTIIPEERENSTLLLKGFSVPSFYDSSLNYKFLEAKKKKITFFKYLKDFGDNDDKKRIKLLDEIYDKVKKEKGVFEIVYDAFKVSGFFDKAVQDINISLIFSSFFKIVESFIEIFPDASFRDFLTEISDVVEYYGRELPLGEFKGCVNLMTVHEVERRGFDYVFIMGCNEGIFPREYQLDTFPYFKEDERKKICFTPYCELSEHLEEERNIFKKAISRADRKVFISYVENNETSPSIYLEDIKIKDSFSHPYVFLPKKKEDIIDEEELKYFISKGGERNTQLIKGFKLPQNFRFTYSNIDSYRRCPFKFYFSEILKIKLPPTFAQERGVIVHKILGEIHSRFKKSPFGKDVTDLINRRLKEELDSLYYLTEWEKNHYGKMLESEFLSYIESMKDFDVIDIEKSIQFSYMGYDFNVRIDRIDKFKDGIKIIDYKTAKKEKSRKVWTEVQFRNRVSESKFKEFDVQFPLYFLALRKEKVRGFEIIYFLEDRVERVEIEVDSETKKRIIELVKIKILPILKNIEEGIIEMEKAGKCFGCDYKFICPYKKEDD